MFQPRLKTILILFATLLTLIIMAPVLAYFSFSQSLDEKLEAKKILKTTEFLVPQILFRRGEVWTVQEVSELLDKNGYRRRSTNQVLLEMDYSIKEIPNSTSDSTDEPLKVEAAESSTIISIATKDRLQNQIEISISNQVITEILVTKKAVPFLSLGEVSIAQFTDNKQLWQKNISLAQVPTQCLQAVIAIEDNQFLEHSGVSFTGILRAAMKNVLAGRSAQGGSTITQQLIKNYILTPEKTYSRKFKEFFYALNIEKKYSKDEILETYLNIIYLGQSGALQIHGYGAASEYYFGKKIENLKLHECALLAAIINNPGRYNPWRNPEPSIKRRQMVLEKMLSAKVITEDENQLAQKTELPKFGREFPSETAPYYIQSALYELKKLHVPTVGNKILLALDPNKQQIAQNSVEEQLNELKQKIESTKKKKKTIDVDRLEVAVLVLDLPTGQITVAAGGKNYRASQFNRITEAKRQVGSLAKPFIYYTALDKNLIQMESLLSNEKQNFTVGKKIWSPDNYNRVNGGQVNLLQSVTQSLNIPVAHLIMQLGVDSVFSTLETFQLDKETPKVPSLALGAFEKTPLEIAEAYATLARFGVRKKSHFVISVLDENHNPIYTSQSEAVTVASPTTSAQVVSLLKWTPKIGTAQVISNNFLWPNAGKTGTTNDYKDAWYVGFTASTLALIWIGYDTPETTHQTGGGLAVPIWKSMMEKILKHQSTNDFDWPESVEKFELTTDQGSFELVKKKN